MNHLRKASLLPEMKEALYKAIGTFALLVGPLYAEIKSILSLQAEPVKTAIYVKSLDNASVLTRKMVADMYFFTESEVLSNPPRVGVHADGQMYMHNRANLVDIRWPHPWSMHPKLTGYNEMLKAVEKRSIAPLEPPTSIKTLRQLESFDWDLDSWSV